MSDEGDRLVSADDDARTGTPTDAPTDLRARIAGLSPAKRALLEQRLQARARTAPQGSAAAAPDASEGAAPLSFGQRRLRLLHRIAPESTAYTVAWALRLHGTLDAERLERALRAVVARHAVLRTTYPHSAASVEGAEPEQHVHAPGALPLELRIAELPAAGGRSPEGEAALRAALADFGARPFALATDGPVRATLYAVAHDEHVLALAVHHIACDGWSLRVIHRDLAAAYAQAADGRTPALPAPRTTYAAYAREQQALAAGDALAAERAYWTAQLADPPPPWELPPGHARPAHRTWVEQHVACTLSPDVTRAVRALARSRKTTLVATLLAAFQATLARWMDLDDVIVGIPEDGRERPELEDVVGFFVNTLAMRARLGDDHTFADHLDATRQAMLDALEHRRLPIEQAVELARPTRSSSHTPLFQALFSMESGEHRTLHLPDVRATPVAMPPVEAKTDLTLRVVDAGAVLELELGYAADYVTPALATRMVQSLATLLEHAAAAPETPIVRLALLPAASRAAELQRGRAPMPASWQPRTVHDLVRRQAELRPHAVAVHTARADGSRTDALTYAELQAAANRLALQLHGLGVARGHRVALLVDRSPLAVVAMLGVVASGGAYVPLDPAHPRPRLADVLADARPTVLLADRAHAAEAEALLSDAHGAVPSLVVLDAATPAVAHDDAVCAPDAGVLPDDTACVIYTSGSTGTPKGVAVRHAGIHSLVEANDGLPLDERSVIAQAATLAFDAATFEVWGALANGGRLAIVPLQTLLTPPALGEALRANAVDTLFLTTALFNELARTRPEALGALRTVIFGGEAADVRAVRELRAALPSLRLVNGYGPTETTTFASVHVVGEVPPEAATIPIGRPLSRVQLHVLDDGLQPVPCGAVGELCIGGAGVAAGYLGRPELTAERFVLAPLGGAAEGERLYRTGDRCRWREDGVLE
ncbi:MAG TPA: amino acid adenylation domain-containing protein, partial [Gemmatimonadaceae bacterium]|nr:amino acid adenylation domain-containing protein [Gemmatimonadaceae bacterium]